MSHIAHPNENSSITNPSGLKARSRTWLRSQLSRSKYLRKIPLRHIEVVIAIIGGINTYLILAYHAEIVSFLEHSFLVLVEKVCIIAGIAGILVYTKFFQEILENKFTLKNRLLSIITFGIISIFGTYSGLQVLGAIVNVRDLAPMVAGLTGGPLVGTCAGLIGSIHRYTLGGVTAFPCSLATVLAGLLGGMVYILNRRRFISVTGAVILAAAMEIIHMLLALLLTSPSSYAVTIVSAVAIPVTFSNAFGMLIFSLIITYHINRQRMGKTIFDDADDAEMRDYQMRAADKIQHAFISDTIPSISGLDIAAFRMPFKTGIVDFYDVRFIAEQSLALTVVDIPGNSFKSSAEMAILSTILREKTRSNGDPESLISYLNKRFMNDEHSNRIMLLYGTLDLNSMTLTYINAGLRHSIVVSNGLMSKLAEQSKLGSLEDNDIRSNRLLLNSGTVLFIRTDGADHAGRSYDCESDIVSIIHRHSASSARDILSLIRDHLTSLQQGKESSNDMVMVVAKALPHISQSGL